MKNVVEYTLNTYILFTALGGAGAYIIKSGMDLFEKNNKKDLEKKLTEKIL
jgi:hypothetical protein